MKKNLVITGGTSGIGLAISKLALKKGYNVFALSRNDFREYIRNRSLYFIKTDISTISQLESAKMTISKILGKNKIDLFINCAGIGYKIPWKKILLRLPISNLYLMFWLKPIISRQRRKEKKNGSKTNRLWELKLRFTAIC